MKAQRSENSVRQVLLCGTLAVLSLMASLWAVSNLIAANRDLRGSRSDLEECRKIADDIRRLQSQPHVASLQLESPQQMLQHISESKRRANIPPDALLSVSPAEPTRIGSTPYRQRVTQLSLTGISLRMLGDFSSSLERDGNGLYLRDVVVTRSRSNSINASNQAESWDARLTLTQLIYSPTSQ